MYVYKYCVQGSINLSLQIFHGKVVLAHITVLLSVSSVTCPPIVSEIGSYLTDSQQKVTGTFFGTRCIIKHLICICNGTRKLKVSQMNVIIIPLKELWRKKTNCAFATHNRVVDIIEDCFPSNKISGRVTDGVSTLFQLLPNSISVRQVVVGTARQEHVVVHVFSETFVAIERMKFPPGVQLDSQTIDDEADEANRQQKNTYACNCQTTNQYKTLSSFSDRIGAKLFT